MQKEGKKQLLVIEPKNEIAFKGPFDHVVTEYFTLKNPTDQTIAFKVKTTAPKRYCVRPNNGQVLPHQTVQVAVMLQPGDLQQEKHKHKFMIQSVLVQSNNNNSNVDELFKSASPDEIMDSKFKCVFLDGLSGIPMETSKNVQQLQSSQAQNHDHHHNQESSSTNDDLLTNGSGGNIADYMSSTSTGGGSGGGAGGISSSINDTNQHQQQQHLDDGISLNYADSEDYANTKTGTTTGASQQQQQLKNRKFNSSSSPSSTKHSDFMPSTTTINSSNYEINSNVSSSNSQDKNDVEYKLKLAQEEIRMLQDKLQQVQRYASKFASTTTDQSSSSTNKSNMINNSSNNNKDNQQQGFLSNNNQQLLQLSALIVFISVIIGIFLGKTVF